LRDNEGAGPSGPFLFCFGPRGRLFATADPRLVRKVAAAGLRSPRIIPLADFAD
jgi:hypothetical protein